MVQGPLHSSNHYTQKAEHNCVAASMFARLAVSKARENAKETDTHAKHITSKGCGWSRKPGQGKQENHVVLKGFWHIVGAS